MFLQKLSLSIYRKGLGKTLLSSFLLISLLPLTFVGISEYYNAKENITENKLSELSSINLLVAREFDNYRAQILKGLQFSESLATTFLQDLKSSWQLSGVPLEEYLESPQYQEIRSWHEKDLSNEEKLFNFNDILLGDAKGNVLFSIKEHSHIGENLFPEENRKKNITLAIKKAMRTGVIQYSDQEYDHHDGEIVSAFILPLKENGSSIGFLAIEVQDRQDLAIILDKRLTDINNVSAFMVGTDQVVRFFNSTADVEYGRRISSYPIETWMKHFSGNEQYNKKRSHLLFSTQNAGKMAIDFAPQAAAGKNTDEKRIINIGKPNIAVYTNQFEREVIGVFSHIKTLDHDYLLISEVEYAEAFLPVSRFRNQLIMTLIITSLIVLMLAALMTHRIVMPLKKITSWVNRVASGEFIKPEKIESNNEIGNLSTSFATMTDQLRKVSTENSEQLWLQEGLSKLSDTIRGDQQLSSLAKHVLTFLCRYLNYPSGAIYILQKDELKMISSYAYSRRKKLANTFKLGEGLPGQAALEKKSIIISVPEEFFSIDSALGGTLPDSVIVMPVLNNGQVIAVMEFAALGEISLQHRKFFDAAMESLAIAFISVQSREQVQILLDQSTEQQQILQKQQEDLQQANHDLESHTNILKESEEELRAQSEELQKANVELEEKTEFLSQQKAEIEKKNSEIEISKAEIEEKASELEEASRYKSEFLANMSHELRTPLNSMLILSSMLADNDDGNLTEEQVESAQVIDKVGHDLLTLINDILDLSKVESGKLEANIEPCATKEFTLDISRQFSAVAGDKGITFSASVEPDVPENIETDYQRLMQILKNLLSNAFKFTDRGVVSLKVFNAPAGSNDLSSDNVIAFAVKDDGIGIPENKQKQIFEAFQQADGSTSRKYGGTGLGLSISREMTHLLGGEMKLDSAEGEGATFTLYLPAKNDNVSLPETETETEINQDKSNGETTEKQSDNWSKPAEENKTLQPASDAPVLIVEDDETFLEIMTQVAEKNNCKYLTARTGANALMLASHYQPRAIILDLGLPDMDGNEVLEILQTKEKTKDIPIHIVSGRDPSSAEEQISSVISYAKKPLSQEQLGHLFSTAHNDSSDEKQLLIADADQENIKHISTLLNGKNLSIKSAKNGTEALKYAEENAFSCLIIDVDLPEGGQDLLSKIHALRQPCPHIILNSNRDISEEEYQDLSGYAGSMLSPGEQKDMRMVDEVTLFMHSIQTDQERTEVSQTNAPARIDSSDESLLNGKKILLVDDDIRNTFALSKALKKYKLDIILADNGQLALEKLTENDDIDLVLMDIMMPVMDGYEAMQRIRAQGKYKNLPIIALTAKAMQDDKAKCLDAGANDYMTKPVDIKKLSVMMQMWLQKLSK